MLCERRRPLQVTPRQSVRRCAVHSSSTREQKTDVLVVGSGIIGINICNTLLRRSGGTLSVALVEKHSPCFGATGAGPYPPLIFHHFRMAHDLAPNFCPLLPEYWHYQTLASFEVGQGYIWLTHRDMRSPAWHLALWSKQLWGRAMSAELADSLEWQESGSLLLGNDERDAEKLRDRAARLNGEGILAEFLDSKALEAAEPALAVTPWMSGLLVTTDTQISSYFRPVIVGSSREGSKAVKNGRLAAETLLQQCHEFGGERFSFSQGEGVAALMRKRSGAIFGAVTESGKRIEAEKGVVLATGAWTGQLLADTLGEEGWRCRFQPRRGHLLELNKPKGMPAINHGLMDVGYTTHYTKGAASKCLPAITFTATTSRSGSILLGSSREFAGFNNERANGIERAILARATAFLPHLEGLSPESSKTRVGLRPFSPDGPVIGGLPGAPGLFVAGGHEGSGLTLAPATAEIIARCILSESVPEFAAAMAPKKTLMV